MSQPEPARRVVLVTGGARGIGRGICDNLAPDHHLLVGGRDLASVESACATWPSAEPFVCDLTDPDATQGCVDRLRRVDVLVHSAGVALGGLVAETEREVWRHLFEVNVVAVADLTRMLLPRLRESRGQVVMVNSGAGFTAGPGGGPYAASKFALRALTDALREEERGRVRVTSIHPGRTDSDMQRDLQARTGRPYRAEEHLTAASVAATVRMAIEASPEAMVEMVSIRPVSTL